MSYGYLSQMLEYLTGAYNRSDIRNDKHSLPMETNIGKLFGTFAWGLELIHEHSDRMLLWDDIDNAQGAVLDRYGANFGVSRGGANDAFYRLLIKVKMISMLSGGDIDTIIKAAANLFNVQASDIEVRELFPAKIWLYVDEDILDAFSFVPPITPGRPASLRLQPLRAPRLRPASESPETSRGP